MSSTPHLHLHLHLQPPVAMLPLLPLPTEPLLSLSAPCKGSSSPPGTVVRRTKSVPHLTRSSVPPPTSRRVTQNTTRSVKPSMTPSAKPSMKHNMSSNVKHNTRLSTT